MTIFNFIDQYIAVTDYYLGISSERYGGGFRAIVGNRSLVDWCFEIIDGEDLAAGELQDFFCENPLFPSSHGGSISGALSALNFKLNSLYEFEDTPIPKYEMKAQCEADSSGETEEYNVSWDDILTDLFKAQRQQEYHFYSFAKEQASPRRFRNLYALINVKSKVISNV
jgi:hypothetical protein